MATPQRSCSRAWFESGEDMGSTETYANVAQSAERKPFKLVVVGSSPTVGIVEKFIWWLFSRSLVDRGGFKIRWAKAPRRFESYK